MKDDKTIHDISRRGRKRKHNSPHLPLPKLLTTHVTISQSPQSEILRGFSMEEEEQYVCVTLPETEHLIQRALASRDHTSISSYGRLYLLCQTFPDVVPGFNLLETRMISHEVIGWPVVMATLYRQGTREGVVQHMKTMARLCSSPREEIFSPKVVWLLKVLNKIVQYCFFASKNVSPISTPCATTFDRC